MITTRDVDRASFARLLAATVFLCLCTLPVARIFQRPGVAWLAALPVVSAIIAAVVDRRSIRGGLHLATVLGGAWFTSRLIGGSAGDTIDGIFNGWSKLLSTNWPSPLRAELGAFVAVVIGVAGTVSAEISVRGRWRAALLLPGLSLGTMFLVLAAPLGALGWGWLALTVVSAAIVLMTTTHDQQRWSVLAGDAPVFIGAVVVFAICLGGVSAIGDLRREDPRDVPESNIERSAAVNPLAQVVAQRDLLPVREIMRVTDRPEPYLRLLALERYDGVSWSFAPTFGSVGRTLNATSDGPATEMTIEALGDPLSWIPVSGEPQSINFDVAADPERSMLYVDPPLAVGETVKLAVIVPNIDETLLTGSAAVPPLRDELSDTLAVVAVRLAGSGDGMYQRLRTMERAMRTEFQLNSQGPAGTNAGVMRLFVETTKVGTEEQFVAAFTLLARSLGARARIAIGYLVTEDREIVTTADARAWPEVWFDQVGWIPFNPTPEQSVIDRPGSLAEVGPGTSPTPPLAATPPAVESGEEPEPVASDLSGFRPRLVQALAVSGGVLGVLALVISALTLVIVLMKRRRRRRRLSADHSADRVVGAWAEATDALVDYGATFHQEQTNLDVARSARDLFGERTGLPLTDLADLADLAAHGRVAPDDLTVAHALRLLGQVEQTMAERHRHLARWRAKVALRSLSENGRVVNN